MRIILLIPILMMLAGCVQRMGKEPDIFKTVRLNEYAQVAHEINLGLDPNTVNGVGDSLLHVATGARGGYEVVDVLLKAGADPNALTSQGRSPLHIAAGWCQSDIVRRLLEGGADPHLTANDGRSPLDATCSSPEIPRQEVVQILRDAMSR